MNAQGFFDLLVAIVGRAEATDASRLFGDLDSLSTPSGLLGHEALAIRLLSTHEALRDWAMAQLWSPRPRREARALAAVIDGALGKMPPYRSQGGRVFFGLQSDRPAALARRYREGGEVRFRGFSFASMTPEGACGGNVLFLVRSRSARLVRHLTGADEILFPSDRGLVVRHVETRDGRFAVLLEEGEAEGGEPDAAERAAAKLFFASAPSTDRR